MPVDIEEALKKATAMLAFAAVSTPLLDAQVLLCHVLQVDRFYLYAHPERVLMPEEERRYFELIQKRAEGMPVQYLVLNQEFMGLDFYVEEGVLIPRADTEILVEAVIQYFQERKRIFAPVIADLGSGSGAIAVSLASRISRAFLYAVDISEKALQISKANAERHGVSDRMRFLRGDLFEPLKAEGLEGKLDALVSNPPYIPRGEIDNLQKEVALYEPRLALDGGEDGLDFYRRIIADAPLFLKEGGLLALEVGYDQAQPVNQMLKEKGCFQKIEIKKDLSGIDRVVTALRA